MPSASRVAWATTRAGEGDAEDDGQCEVGAGRPGVAQQTRVERLHGWLAGMCSTRSRRRNTQ